MRAWGYPRVYLLTPIWELFIMGRQAYHLMRAVGNVALLQNRGTHLYTKIGKTDQAEARDSTALLVSIR